MSGQVSQSVPDGTASTRAKARGENFPVAATVLPRAYRGDLMALYTFARRVDDIGDAAPGDRMLLLDEFAGDVDRLFAGGRPADPAVSGLASTVRERGFARAPFDRLIEANRRDQTVTRYTTFDELLEYCALSANPVGELVLGVFGVDTESRRHYSDQVCTALQILEHCQDVAEDHAAGRVYLPGDDMAFFGVSESELAAEQASRPLRALVGFQVQRAVGMLDAGAALLATLHGAARFAVAGYLAGGYATAEALARARFDILTTKPRPTKTAMALESARLLAGALR